MLIKGLLLLRVLQLKVKAEWIICTLIKGWHGNFLLKDLKEDTLKSLLKKGLEEEQTKYSFLKKRGEQK